MRATLTEIARRAYNSITRCTIRKVNDKPLMQEVDIDGVFGERMTGIERMQPYGFSSNIQPDQSESSSPTGASPGLGSGSTRKGQGHAAEGVVVFVNGDRSHPIVIQVDDRRYRIKGLQSGELALYDDQQQQVHITRNGIMASVPHDKSINWRVMPQQQQSKDGDADQPQSDGQDPQATKQPYAWHSLDKNGYTINHPGQIVHNIVDDQGNVKYSMTLNNSGGCVGNFSDVQWNQTP